MKRTIKYIAAFLAVALLLASALSFAGCSQDSGTLLELDGNTLSLNAYEFLLSRMKGVLVSLYATGSSVNPLQSSYWSTVADTDGTTYDDYYKDMVLKEAYKYVEALYMFSQNNLSLSQSELDEIDKTIDSLIENAGSVNDLNSTLSAYGFNVDMLKQLYTDEAKIALLKKTLFGENGEKISDSEKNGYFADEYVAFKQIFVASYYYVNETDSNGDTIYYNSDGKIAYDDINGFAKKDEYDNWVTDSDGQLIYYTEDGKIAYDKENGSIKRKTDSSGDYTTAKYADEELAGVIANANELSALAKSANQEEFENLIAEFSDTESNSLIYLNTDSDYSSQSSSLSYMDDISTALAGMKIGDVEIIKSSYGYHIIRKYSLEEKAYDMQDDEHKEIFEDFYSDLISYEFAKECEKYDSLVVVDKEVYEKAVSMNDIGYNKYY